MCFEYMKGALKAKTGNHLRHSILIHLADRADKTGFCWPSYATIAEDCNCSRRSVMRHIKTLVENGLITSEDRVFRGHQTSNGYRLNSKLKTNFIAEKTLSLMKFGNDSGSDSESLGVVTDCHRGGDRESPGVVTDCHRGGDRESPKPIIEPIIKPKQGKTSRFVPPSVLEIQEYLDSLGVTTFNGQQFHDHYEAGNWYRGKTKIKKWKGCVTTWRTKNPEPLDLCI